MGNKCPPMVFAGTGTGKFPPCGDGDGGSIHDGEFPIAILSHGCTGRAGCAGGHAKFGADH